MKKFIGTINFLLIIYAIANGVCSINSGIEPINGFLKNLWAFFKTNYPSVPFLIISFAIMSVSFVYLVLSAINDKDGKLCQELQKSVDDLKVSNETALKEKEDLSQKITQSENRIIELEKASENSVPLEQYENAKNKISEMEEAAYKAIEELKSLTDEGSKLALEVKTLKEHTNKLSSENKTLCEKLENHEEIKKELKQVKEELAAANANLKGGKNAIPPAAYQILYMLQKEGRLIDMLNENISEYDDETLGGAFRKLHEDLSGILKDRLIIEPVLNEEEGTTITIENADPESIKISGRVPEKGPYTGELIHRGWRLKECKLPELVDGWKGDVIAPAEIEIE